MATRKTSFRRRNGRLWGRGVSAVGVSVQRVFAQLGVYPGECPPHTQRKTALLPADRMTDTCENITFPTTVLTYINSTEEDFGQGVSVTL